jgi:predicted  nucleic acid-binding Zn-ribbon protein
VAQGKETPNIGLTGVESIRLRGMKIDDLPIAEAARVREQLRKAEEDERQSLIDDIKARYPTQGVAYIESRIRESRGNIARFREQRIRIGGDQEEYRMLLRDTIRRDEKIEAAREQLSGDALGEEIRSLTVEFGPWQRKGLEAQLQQFGESIKRFEDTIGREQESIDQLTELLGQCRARDKELARVGT